jgi:hypothetical protein
MLFRLLEKNRRRVETNRRRIREAAYSPYSPSPLSYLFGEENCGESHIT